MHDASVSKYRFRELVYRKIYYVVVATIWLLAIWLMLNNGPVLDIIDDNG